MKFLCTFFSSVLRPLVGDINWRPPGWMLWLMARPLALVGILVLVVGGYFGNRYYQNWLAHQPKPVQIGWNVTSDIVTANSTLYLGFQKSVGRLDLIGKPLTSGVSISPQIAGTWKWANGMALIFDPAAKNFWTPGTEYTVTVGPEIVSPHVLLDHFTQTFTTLPFTATIGDQLFYVNPKDPTDHRVTATLNFTQPVDRNSLESNLQFTVQNLKADAADETTPLKFTATYPTFVDPLMNDRVVYVRSEPIGVAEKSGYARITIPTSVTTIYGGAALKSEVGADVLVPSETNLFRIESANVVIVNKVDNGDPEQDLIVKTSVGIESANLASAVHVYLLPKFKKPGDTDVYEWKSGAEVDDKIRGRLEPLALTPIPDENEFSTIHSFHINVPEDRYTLVEVEKGTEGIGSFKLATKYSDVEPAPKYPRQVTISHNGSLLALNGERKLTISSRGVDEIEFRLARVTPGQINHLVSQTEGSFNDPTFVSSNFDETNLAEEITRRTPISLKNNSETNYSSLDFSEFVTPNDQNKGKLGLFLLHAIGRKAGPDDGGFYKSDGTLFTDADVNQKNKDNQEILYPVMDGTLVSDERLILITDMGLVIKDNNDHTHDIFVQSIKTGDPVPNAHVEILGKNGIPVATAETDITGHAAIPTLEDFVREQRPVAYVVTKGQDVSFLPFGRDDRLLNFSRFDTGGIQVLSEDDLRAFLFTDRGIYRPGDSAHIALIAKQHNWKGNLNGISLELDITDPKEATVLTRNVKLNASGLAETTFDTSETSPTGVYTVSCYLVKDSTQNGQDNSDKVSLGSETFQVKEFLPDRLKLTVTSLKSPDKGWLNLTELKTHLQLDNLYGAPADGNKVTAKLSIRGSSFNFDSLPGYSFSDPYAEDSYKENDKLDIDLDPLNTDGNGQVDFDLNQSNIRSCATQVSVLFEAFEKEGGRSVRGYTEALVSTRSWLMGVKEDGDFNYIKHDSKHTAHLLAVDSDLKPKAVSNLTLKKIEHRFVSVLVEQQNGNFAYQSVEKLIPSGEEKLDLPEAGTDWNVPTGQPGTFEADVFDDKGDKVAVINYCVTGAANLSQVMDKNAELSAKLSKTEYKPGEQVEVSITAPYTGAGLLTIERDKVYSYQWFQAKTTSSVQKITIPADMEGNGYLNVTFVRSLDSKEIYLSPLSYAVLPFTINKEARHTQITIDAPKLGTPGQPLTWTVKASRPTQAVVYAVDEGILQVAGYTLPDPLSYFFQKESLSVDTRQTVDQILPEYSISRMVAAAGGDSGEDLLSHHLNPFKRKHDAPVAFWSGIVDLGTDAKTFTYNVPDYFAGTIRIMVVTDSYDAVGASQQKLPVRGPFVILPNTPSVVAPGDDFDVSVTIANNVPGSGANAPIDLEAELTDGLKVKEKPGATTISEGHDGTVHWLLHADKVLGNADFTVIAKSGNVESKLASHISIRPPSSYLTSVKSGYFAAGIFTSGFANVPIDRKLYPQYRENFAQASALPMGLSRGLATYLQHYEYGCTEQLVSKTFPSLVSNDTLELGQTHDEVQKSLDDIVGVAETRQNDEGGIGLWDAKTVDSPLYTCYVMHLLTEAKDRDYQVNDDFFNKCLDYLEKKVGPDPSDYYDARVQCYAIYILTRNGRVTTNYIEHTRGWLEKNGTLPNDPDFWKNDIACAQLASSYALLKNQAEADKLIQQFHLIGPQAEYSYDFYNALGRDGLYLDLISHHFPDRLKLLKPEDIQAIVNPVMAGDYNTISAAEAILGLDSYAHAVGMKGAVADLAIGQMINGQEVPLKLTGTNYPRGDFGGDADSIVYHKPTKNQVGLPGLYYQITQSGFDDETITKPISEGIEVSREYVDTDGKPVTTIHLGDELRVLINIRAVGYDTISNVVVEDLLPGGFEVESDYIHSGEWDRGYLNYADVREDRVNLFGEIGGGMETVEYRLKATNKGTFIVPPVQAESMYNRKIRARTVNSTITVD